MMLSSREASVDYMMHIRLHHIFTFDHQKNKSPSDLGDYFFLELWKFRFIDSFYSRTLHLNQPAWTAYWGMDDDCRFAWETLLV